MKNKKKYVGKTKCPDIRWRVHKNNVILGSKLAIHCAMRKYGIKNFKFSVVKEFKTECAQLDEEIRLIRKTLSPLGYNIHPGGKGGGIPGRKQSREHVEKCRASNTGKIRTKQQCLNISLSLRGKIHSPEHIANWLKSRESYKPSEETCRKISLTMRGKKFSDIHRIRIGLAHLGKKHSPRHVANWKKSRWPQIVDVVTGGR